VPSPPLPNAPEPTLWLVRHGESTWNALGLIQGHSPEPLLTRQGWAQAKQAAGQLAGRPVAAVFSSDLRRALDSAGPISRAVDRELVVDVRLRERGFGVLEGLSSDRLTVPLSGIVEGRVADADAAPEGGESVRQLVGRVARFLDELDPGRGDVVLVVHGGVVRAALAHLDGIVPDDMPWTPVHNGEVFSRPLARRRDGGAAAVGSLSSSLSAAQPMPLEVRS